LYRRRYLVAAALSFASVVSPSARAQNEPSSFHFEVRGYAMLDYVQAFQGVNPNWDAALRPSRIATDEDVYGTHPYATLSVRQSRFGVYGDVPAAGDQVHTEFEFDLFGVGNDEGQTTIRPRQIYGSWKWLLAGQANSVFMDGDIFPNVIEYWGPSGMVLYRNPQLRLTPIRGSSSLAFAIERPGTIVDGGTLPGSYESRSPIPDFTAHYRFTTPAGHVQLAGLLRDLAYRGTAPGLPPWGGGHLGWGAHASGVATAGGKSTNVTFRLSAVYGHGIANYMNDGGVDLARTSIDGFEAQPLVGIVGFLDLTLSELVGASLGYSFTQVENSEAQAGDAFHRGDYASANLLLTPLSNLLAGMSYTWGRRTDNDGDTGVDQRVQLSVKYSFSSRVTP
jgi:hypothetical protein